jgi:hypothetical protein
LKEALAQAKALQTLPANPSYNRRQDKAGKDTTGHDTENQNIAGQNTTGQNAEGQGTESQNAKTQRSAKARPIDTDHAGISQHSTQELHTPPIDEEAPVVDRVILQPQHTLLPGTKVYTQAQVSVYSWGGEFHLEEYEAQQKQLMQKIVEAEGPIHMELAARRMTEAWGISRTGPRIMKRIEEVVDNCIRNGVVRKKGEFLWPNRLLDINGPQNIQVRVPTRGATEPPRAINHIPPEEIQQAMLLLTEHSVGIHVTSLLPETARLFGFNRMGEKIKKVLQQQLDHLQSAGKLINIEDTVSLAH